MTNVLSLGERPTGLSTIAKPVRIRDWLAGQFSLGTRRAYASDVRAFQMWTTAQGVNDLGTVTSNLVIVYRNELNSQNNAVSTIACKLSCVRQVLGYAHA